MKWPIALSILALASSPGLSQELTDVVLGEDEEGAWIWLAFDQQPISVIQVDDTHLVVDGLALESRQIELSRSDVVNSLDIAPTGTSQSEIRFTGAIAFLQPELRLGGVLVRWTAHSEPSLQPADPAGVHAVSPDSTVTPEVFPVLPAEAVFAVSENEAETEDIILSSGPGQTSQAMNESELRIETEIPSGPSMDVPSDLTSVTESIAESSTRESNEEAGIADESSTSAEICVDTGTSLEASPWDFAVMSTHARCLVEAGASDQAVTLYEQILAFEPEHFEAAMGLAEIKAGLGDYNAARQLYLDAARSAQTDGEALRAHALARQMELEG